MTLNGWEIRCQHCGHQMHFHVLDWDDEPESDCYELGCQCPGFEPRKEPDDADR